jgi:hypothetical protein
MTQLKNQQFMQITKLNSSLTGTTEYDLLKPAALRYRNPHTRGERGNRPPQPNGNISALT